MFKTVQQILEGSRAISLTIKAISPNVISAYPITPQTHIVEDLAKFKANGKANYEFIRAESEFAAASIVLGATAAGARAYTATSSQGLLLMTEVIYNIAGMRLPLVITLVNRAVSAPISIWNDQQDVHAISQAGWILLFASDHQEAVDQHIMAYRIAEQTKIPVMVNVDGFIITHSYEPVEIYDEKKIKKYIGNYKPEIGSYLDPDYPITMGAFAAPNIYMEIRKELHIDLLKSLEIINKEYENFCKIFKSINNNENHKIDNGLIEYFGPRNAKIIIVAMGSVIGTIKEAVKKMTNIGILKIKTYRPFPAEDIKNILKKSHYVAVIDKAIDLGNSGPLARDIRAVMQEQIKNFHCHNSPKIQSFIMGLGGRDITTKMIQKIIEEIKNENKETKFIEK